MVNQQVVWLVIKLKWITLKIITTKGGVNMSNALALILAIISTGVLLFVIYLLMNRGEELFDKIMDIFVRIYLYVLVPLCFIIIFYVIFISI